MRQPQHDVRREGDQFSCARCGKAWDVKDPKPPPCVSREEAGQKHIEELREILDHGK